MPYLRDVSDRLKSVSAWRVATSVVVFGVSWGLLHVGYWGGTHVTLSGDVQIYEGYGSLMRQHQIPYRDFALVYPPGSIPAFLIPTWASDYGDGFEACMFVCGLLLVVVIALAHRTNRGLALVALSPVLVGGLVSTRFDLWPTLLLAGALVLLAADRHRQGWALLGFAIATKVFPVVIVPVAAVWTFRRARNRFGQAALVGLFAAVLPFVPFGILGRHGLVESFRQQFARPLQVESLGGSLMILAHKAGIVNSYGSANVTGQAAQPLELLLGLATIGALVALWVRFAKGAMESEQLFRYAASCVCAFVAFDKVLSPQYLIWLLPPIALLSSRRGTAAMVTLIAALLLTQVWTPTEYVPYIRTGHDAWIVFLRDLVLVGLLALLALESIPRASRRQAIGLLRAAGARHSRS